MHEGLWLLEFQSEIGLYGKGIAVLRDGKMLGGDAGFYYQGDYSTDQNSIDANIDIIRHDSNYLSVYGNLDHFTIELKGEMKDDYRFDATGHIKDRPDAGGLRIKGIQKVDFENATGTN